MPMSILGERLHKVSQKKVAKKLKQNVNSLEMQLSWRATHLKYTIYIFKEIEPTHIEANKAMCCKRIIGIAM